MTNAAFWWLVERAPAWQGLGVPLGGVLFAIEVVRGALALRFILPALLCSSVATAVSWTLLPNAPTYTIPAYPDSHLSLLFAILCGLAAGPFAVLYVRFVRWAERNKPSGWQRIVRLILGRALLGLTASRFPQLLGNGRDVSQLLFASALPFALAALLLVRKPAAIVLCMGSKRARRVIHSFAHIRRFARFPCSVICGRSPFRMFRPDCVHSLAQGQSYPLQRKAPFQP